MSDADIARRSTRGSFALFAGNLPTAVISAIAIIVITRLLGPANYGIYTLAILFPNILFNFLGLGVNSGITRYAAYHISKGEPEIAKRMTVNGLVFLLSFGVLLSAISYLAAGPVASFLLGRPGIAGVVRIASLFLFSQALFQSAVSALLGWSLMGYISLSNVSQSLMRVAISVALVLLGFGVAGAILGYSVSLSLGAVLAYFLLWRQIRGARGTFLEGFTVDIRTMLGYGVPIFIGQLSLSLSAQYVIVLLAGIASNAYVGYVQAASNVTTIITLISGAISQALFPAFAHLDGVSSNVGTAFRYATKYMGFILTPVVFLVMGSASQIVHVLYGASFSPAATYLVLLAFANVAFLFGYGVLPSFFTGTGKPVMYMVFAFAGAGSLALLAPLLGVYAGLGIPGLIYSTIAANLVASAVGISLAMRYTGASFDAMAAVSIAVSSLAGYVVLLALETLHIGNAPLLVLDIIVFSFVYLTLSPILRALRNEDMNLLQTGLGDLGGFGKILLPILRYERFLLRVTGG